MLISTKEALKRISAEVIELNKSEDSDGLTEILGVTTGRGWTISTMQDFEDMVTDLYNMSECN